MSENVDPVCGMKVDPDTDLKAEHEGRSYLFCSQKCMERFLQNPHRFNLEAAMATREEGRGNSPADYIPLGVLLAVTSLSAGARQFGVSEWSWTAWMHDFMGLFLVMFAMLKLFDLQGFVNGFGMYDLLAQRLRAWGYLYPFLELGLGLAFLARWQPTLTYSMTAALLGFGALGVLNALRTGLDVECACMGSALKVPLSTVALVEDVGMAAMAGAMLATR